MSFSISGHIPTRIYSLPLCALDQFLHRRRPDILQVVCRRARDDGIPDNRLVRVQGLVLRGAIGPRRGDVDEDLLGVPGEEGGEVSGEGEADRGIFFFLVGVVVWAAPDSGRRGD
jgi:hypothetical protein